MKTLLSSIGLIAILSAAQAHDSWAPHTHTLDNRHSDLFYLCVAGIIAFIAGALVLRALARRRDAKPPRATRRFR